MPTDLLQQLSLPHNGADPTLLNACFCGAIASLQQELEASDRHLVIRSHSHTDFFTAEPIAPRPLITSLLAPRWPLRQMLSVRHPLDSWLSLRKGPWLDQLPFRDLASYCQRIELMLQACGDMPMMRYEEFCGEPETSLRTICQWLMLPCDPEASLQKEQLLKARLSGNSGRSANIIKITPRRLVPEDLAHEAMATPSYRQVCSQLGYNPDPGCAWPFLA